MACSRGTECEITLRRMPAGDQVRVVRIAADIVRALAFSPDGRFLAAIGGEAQELTVHEVNGQGAEPVPPVSELRGPGTVLWDVGFIADAPENPRVAYARNRPMSGQAALWEGFDLRGRRVRPGRASRPAPPRVRHLRRVVAATRPRESVSSRGRPGRSEPGRHRPRGGQRPMDVPHLHPARCRGGPSHIRPWRSAAGRG